MPMPGGNSVTLLPPLALVPHGPLQQGAPADLI